MTVKAPLHNPEAPRRRNHHSVSLHANQNVSDAYASSGYGFENSDLITLRGKTDKPSHWSIAWSDLMMTMFILFLSLFIYQAAHKDFLVSDKDEILGGETAQALTVEKKTTSGVPFMPIKPKAPLITAGTIRKIEVVHPQDINLEDTFSSAKVEEAIDEIFRQVPALSPKENPSKVIEAKVIEANLKLPPTPVAVTQPAPLQQSEEDSSIANLFKDGQESLTVNDLNNFAAIDLVPDRAVRIVLTSDLLFATGEAALSIEAISSLEKLAAVIQNTPHSIHVEGHTDDIPIHSSSYANNWELSMARANAVANFLINDMKMNPSQFIVSGFASYKPMVPNSSELNRAKNRRVEIVITKDNSAQPENQTSLSLKL